MRFSYYNHNMKTTQMRLGMADCVQPQYEDNPNEVRYGRLCTTTT